MRVGWFRHIHKNDYLLSDSGKCWNQAFVLSRLHVKISLSQHFALNEFICPITFLKLIQWASFEKPSFIQSHTKGVYRWFVLILYWRYSGWAVVQNWTMVRYIERATHTVGPCTQSTFQVSKLCMRRSLISLSQTRYTASGLWWAATLPKAVEFDLPSAFDGSISLFRFSSRSTNETHCFHRLSVYFNTK